MAHQAPANRSLFGRCQWTVRRGCLCIVGGRAGRGRGRKTWAACRRPTGATLSRHPGFSTIGLSTAPAGVDSQG